MSVRRLQRFEALLEVARLQEVRGRDPDGDEGTRPADGVLLAEQVGPHDLEDAPHALHGVQAREVVGDCEGAFLAPPQAAHAACLGGLRGPLGVMGEAVGTLMLRAGAACLAVRHRRRTRRLPSGITIGAHSLVGYGYW